GGGKRREGQGDADRSAGEGRREQRPARATAEEGDSLRADDEDDERLAGERLDEPAGAEERLAGVEDEDHHREGEKVVQGADRTEEGHEAADECDVPLRGPSEGLTVDLVCRVP